MITGTFPRAQTRAHRAHIIIPVITQREYIFISLSEQYQMATQVGPVPGILTALERII